MNRFLIKFAYFFIVLLAVAFLLDYISTSGLVSLNDDDFHDLNILMNKNIEEDIIIIGSSRAWNHFDPEIIDSMTNRRSRVIGLSGAKSVMQSALINAFLDREDISGKTLVHVVGSLEVGAREDGIFKKYKFIPYLSNEQIYQSLKQVDKSLYLEKYIPLAKFQGFYDYFFKGILSHFVELDNYNKYKGFIAFNEEWDGQLPESSYSITQDDINLSITLLKEEISLAQSKKIDLVIVYTPEHVLTNRVILNKEEYLNALRKTIAEYSNVKFYDYSTWENNHKRELFHNASHLNRKGASFFTRDFAADLVKE